MKTFLGVVLLLMGVVGLGMSLCGAFFTLASLGKTKDFLVIAIPAVLIGAGISYGCYRGAMALFAEDSPPPPPR